MYCGNVHAHRFNLSTQSLADGPTDKPAQQPLIGCDLCGQWKVTGLWDLGPRGLMAVIPPQHDLGIGRNNEEEEELKLGSILLF